VDVFGFVAFDLVSGYVAFGRADTNPVTTETDRFTFQPPSQLFIQVGELLPASETRRWVVDSIVCDRPAQIGDTTVTLLMSGPTVCTFTNRLLPPVRLTVTKRTVDRSGGIVASDGPFIIEVDGGGGNETLFTLDTNPATATLDAGTATLARGRVRLSENAPAGWRFESLTCDNAVPNAVPTTSGRAYELDLTVDTSCVVTNRSSAIEVTVQKATIDATGAPIESDRTFAVTTVADRVRSSSLDTTPRTTSRSDRDVYISTVGSHEITESVPRGWELASVVCNGVPATINATSAVVDLQVDSLCVLTNRLRPSVPVTITLETLTSSGAAVESLTDVEFRATGTTVAFLSLDTSPLSTLPATGVLDLPVGSYRIDQTPPPGWRMAAVTCTGATPAVDGAAFVIDVTGPVSCVVRNQQVAAATLRIAKTTSGPGGVPIESATAFGFDRSGDGAADFTLDTSAGTTTPDATTLTLTPDVAVTVSEIVPAGWRLADISCSGGAALVLRDADNAPTGVRVNPPAGAAITCTFRNQSVASSLTVVKETVDSSGTRLTSTDEFVITSPTVGVGPFALDTHPSTTRPSSIEVAVAPGAIVLSEAPSSPWTLAAVTCTVGHQARVVGGRLVGVTVDVEPGQRAICVFTNERPAAGTATLTIRKVTEAADGTVVSNPVDFTLRGSGAIGTVVLDTDPLDRTRPDRIERSLAPGSYSITEDAASGWTLRSLLCTGATTAVNRAPLTGVDLTVAAGQQVECVFVNRADVPTATATLTIRKEGRLPAGLIGPVVQQFRFSGTGPIGDFALDLDATSATPQERTFTLAPGAYSVAELGIPGDIRGWDLEDIACINASTTDISGGTTGQPGLLGTTVTLAAGVAAVCNFVNRGGGTTVDVVLETRDVNGFVIDDDQDFAFTVSTGASVIDTFVLDTGNTGPSGDRRFVFVPGTYRITVAPVTGWTLVDVRCDELAAPVLDGSGRLIGVDLNVTAVQSFRGCRFVHRRASVGTATIQLVVETRSFADVNVPVETSNLFGHFLTSIRGDVLRRVETDTSPATPRPASATTVVEAGYVGWVTSSPLSDVAQFAVISHDCGRPLTRQPLGPFGKDITGDQVNDDGYFFTVGAGENVTCRVIFREEQPPAEISLEKRVVDGTGTDYRYGQPFTYRVTYGDARSEEDTVATTDNFTSLRRGAPGTWTIVEREVASIPFVALSCTDSFTSAVVPMTR
jgi:hypothetical protein